ncbi:plasmid mobilization relaxosome protein MobC [Streptomyces sp. A0642]|uniref:plasmid mobilization relaxosome protein MobC n=1 Tax=Streptomyces sp. A0642 TaxID=2563100 RepID=UPI001447C51C|nr:plasmid mobilization relaxosome protein MobC [Streptomyces sp. A0642]
MAEPSAAGRRRSSPPRRREREADGPRDNRVKVSYNDSELTILNEAASRDNQALASWIASAALAVAEEKVVPVSAAMKDVLADLVKARTQVTRVGTNVNQIARVLNSEGEVTDPQLSAALRAVQQAVRRLDEATLQLMRERRNRL